MTNFIVEVRGSVRVRSRFSIEAGSEDEAKRRVLEYAKKSTSWKGAKIEWTVPPERMSVLSAAEVKPRANGRRSG